MRLSAVLLVLSLLGVVAGAALIGPAAVGGAVIFDSLCVGIWALRRDDGAGERASVRPLEGVSLGEVLQRARQAP